MNNQDKLTTQDLSDMTMDLLVKRLSEESPHLSNPDHGFGILEIVYNFNSAPRISDRYSIIKNSGGEFEVSFPVKKYDEKLLKKNIKMLYYIVNQYLSTRVIPQGKLTIEFSHGIIISCDVNNEGTYKDLERTGRPKMGLDDILFDEEDQFE
jgi:hypothetical protein